MRLPALTYHQPQNLAEALGLAARDGDKAAIMGGGTALIVSLRQRRVPKDSIIHLGRVAELCFIEEAEGSIRIGAATPLRMLLQSEAVRRKIPLLASAAARVASAQVRNTATIGGNLCLDNRCCYYNRSKEWLAGLDLCLKRGGTACHAVPNGKECHAVSSSDLAPALMALNARVAIEAEGSRREIPLADLYTGRGEKPLNLGPSEILTGVEVPISSGLVGSAYLKLANREAVDYPLLSVATILQWEGGKLADVGIALGATAASPRRVVKAEHFLKEQGLSLATAEKAAEFAFELARPAPNTVFSAAYRKKMARLFAMRSIAEASRQAGEQLS